MAKNKTNRVTYIDTYNNSEDYDYIDDFWTNLKYADFGECEVSGSLGLWWGSPDIEPKRFSTLYDAVSACANDAWDLIVYLENGILYVDAMHHDGTNSFTIKPMIKGKRFPKYLW